MMRVILALLVHIFLLVGSPALTQAVDLPQDVVDRPSGAQTLDDILQRQVGMEDKRMPRDLGSADDAAAGLVGALGTRGNVSDSGLWEELRFGTSDVKVSAGGAPAKVVIQDNGMWWLKVRQGPLATYGGWSLLGVIGLIAIFFLIRGRVRIENGFSGIKILRFAAIERFAHWLIAGSFILLALTGLFTLFGRHGLMSVMGKDTYAMLASWSKWTHNNVSWAFMIALVMIFVMWVIHNLPSRLDLIWLAKGGGIVGNAHPSARKFNAGQKIIFWSVVLIGGSISLSGLSLLFPFDLPMFGKTFAIMNELGVPNLLGMNAFPTPLAPHEEMQFAQLWHAIASFVLMAIIIGHIYIGTLGMEGAYDAMGSGEVDLNWAKEHHDLWVEEVQSKEASVEVRQTTPAE